MLCAAKELSATIIRRFTSATSVGFDPCHQVGDWTIGGEGEVQMARWRLSHRTMGAAFPPPGRHLTPPNLVDGPMRGGLGAAYGARACPRSRRFGWSWDR